MSRHKVGTQWVTDPDPFSGLTPRQRHIADTVRAFAGNRSRAARHLGINVAGVQAALRICAAAGVLVPPAVPGRRGIPNREARILGPRCIKRTASGPCGRPEGHRAACTSEAAWQRRRLAA